MFTTRRQLGQEAIRWRNGSLHGITSNTEKAGHGETLDLGVIDEAFAQEDARIEQAFKPAMITRQSPQLWVVSTAGTDRSLYLKGKVETGRALVAAGVDQSVAYFEWSALDDADPADPATWWSCMPALGNTVQEDAVRADFTSMKLAEFRRAYLNQWPDAAPEEWQVIPQQAWRSRADEGSKPRDPVAFAIDVNPDRSFAAIASAGDAVCGDGCKHVEIVQHDRGTSWVVERMRQLVAKWRPCAVVVDASGPAGSLIAPLEAAGIEVLKPSARDAAQACGQFLDAVMDGDDPPLRHRGQPALTAAVAGAARRPLGDAWAWARKSASADISPLVAATLALWGHGIKAAEFEDYDVLESVW